MSINTGGNFEDLKENLKQDKLNNLVNLVKKEIPNIKKIIKEKNIEISNDNLDLFIENGLKKFIEKIENNEDCKDDYTYFLLEALIKNNKKCIIDSLYNPNCSGNYDIFEEIQKIKNKEFSSQKELDLEIDENKLKYEKEYPNYKRERRIKKLVFEKNVYYTKKYFFDELSPELQDDLLEKLEGKTKKQIQEMVMELEEIYKNKKIINLVKVNLQIFFSQVKKIIELNYV